MDPMRVSVSVNQTQAPNSGRVRAKETGPGHSRRSPSRASQRSALPATLPRPVKLTRGGRSDVPPPGHIRVIGAELVAQDRDLIAQQLGRKFGKFASAIERITVRLSDANGPKGGRDRIAQIKVVLSGHPSVVIEEREVAFRRAVDRAMKAAALAVRRSLQRRRFKLFRERQQPVCREAAGWR